MEVNSIISWRNQVPLNNSLGYPFKLKIYALPVLGDYAGKGKFLSG